MVSQVGENSRRRTSGSAVTWPRATPRNFAKSASRALDVLLYLANRRSPARAWEIARELGFAASSADQLLKTMLLSGYLIFRSDDKTYAPSPKLGRFARWLTEIYPSDDYVADLLEELHRATGLSVSFSVESDGFMVISDYISARSDTILEQGVRVPILRSALGGAVLAARSNTDIRRVLDRARQLRTIEGAVTPAMTATVIHSINQFRQVGYAWKIRDEHSPQRPAPPGEGFMSLAVRLRSTDLGSGMAFGLAGVAREVRPRQTHYATLMHDLADKYGLAAA